MQKYEATLTVQVQQSTTADAVMRVSSEAVTVSVKDITPVTVTDKMSLGHVLDRRGIEQLPINGRNITNLLVTVPGLDTGTGSLLRRSPGRPRLHPRRRRALRSGGRRRHQHPAAGARHDPGVPGREQRALGQVQPAHQHYPEHQERHQSMARLAVRNPAQQRLRKGPREDRLGRASHPDSQRVRRHGRRPGLHPQTLQRQESDVLVFLLRRLQQSQSGIRVRRGAHAGPAQRRFQPDARFAGPPAGHLRPVHHQLHHLGSHSLPGQHHSHRPAESALEIHLCPDSAAHLPRPQSAAAIQLVRPRPRAIRIRRPITSRFDHSFSDRDKFYARYTQGNQIAQRLQQRHHSPAGRSRQLHRPAGNQPQPGAQLGEDSFADLRQ